MPHSFTFTVFFGKGMSNMSTNKHLLRLTIEENKQKAAAEMEKQRLLEEEARKNDKTPTVRVENWKVLEALPIYLVSDHGGVINRETRKQLEYYAVARDGAIRVTLHKDKVRYTAAVHRLVASVFLPEYDPQRAIIHRDGDKENNCVTNLMVGKMLPLAIQNKMLV